MHGYKKHRGLRRYYKNLHFKTDDWSGLSFSNTELAWFDLWHTHFDWYGYGNSSFRKRKPHLDKLFRHFHILQKLSKSLDKDFQLWVLVLDFESSSDALFLHTPNPNRNNFPYLYSGLSTASTLTNAALKDYIDELEGYEKLYGNANEAFALLFTENIGRSLVP